MTIDWRDSKAVHAFLRRNDPVIDQITEVMTRNKVSQVDGEAIFLLLAGTSAGLRQASIVGDFVDPLGIGWTLAAKHGGEFEL